MTPPAPRPLRPSIEFDPELLLRAQGIRVAIFDVDGCLTDGRIYIGEHGEAEKAFNTLDGQGIKLLPQVGIEPVVITGRDTPAVRKRCTDLGIRHALFGVHDKLAAADRVLGTLGQPWSVLAVIGDDWPDLPLLTRAAFACAPAGAHVEARSAAHYVTRAAGGHGAAREFCDVLLVASGQYARLLQTHCVTLDLAQDPPQPTR